MRISQLRESTEIASGQDRLAGHELYDLVMLSGGGSVNEVGVIVRVGVRILPSLTTTALFVRFVPKSFEESATLNPTEPLLVTCKRIS